MKKINTNQFVIFGIVLFISSAFIAWGYFLEGKDKLKLVDVCLDRNTRKCSFVALPFLDKKNSTELRVDDLISRMTLPEKIGQMMLIERISLKSDKDIATYGLGGLLSGMGSKPAQNTPKAWLKMVNDYSQISKTTRLGIPILYGIDGIHGHSNIENSTIFPHFIGLGATGDSELVKKIALATTEELAATGIYWNYSPNLDVLGDPRWGRFYESFGSNTKLVSDMGKSYVNGINLYNLTSIKPIGTAKHFVGAGAMLWDKSYNKDFKIDQGESIMSLEELRKKHLPSFKVAIDAGVSSVMIGLNSWQNKKLSETKYLITDVLKKELAFKGIVVSDWYGVYEIDKNKYKSAVIGINSGIDMVMLPFEYKRFMSDINEAVLKGDISQERIDNAVRRILTVKFNIGLFDNPEQGLDGLKVIGSKEHRELARKAVRESLVLLKNKSNVLPLNNKSKKIFVSGRAADNLGMQMGGWSIEWQGVDGNWTTGTNILEGFRKIASPQVEIEYDINGLFDSSDALADIGIAVVGENPYAEGWGDNDNLNLGEEDLDTINNLKEHVKKIIVIIVSGRPLDIKNEINSWDAVVAAWLPGSEGEGVADIIFGEYPFSGTLPVPWDLSK